ncbi:MAG: DUF4340 domain-containing protein [Desulfobacteraceae bacterium]|nr:MAG: DUF4340 domain-containing protein [Desulfobacteraceae bacterium]
MKKEYIILAVIIAALTLYLVFHKPDNIHYQLPRLSVIQQNVISKIEIIKDGKTLGLIKKDDKWRIVPEQYPADTEMIRRMLDVIDDLAVTALVSESENYVRYELDDKNRIHVKAFKGDDIIREFYIGKAAPSFNHTFIRLQTDPKVYHAGNNFRSGFDQTMESLRDKTVLSFHQNDIHEVLIEKGQQQIAFVQKQIPVEKKAESAEKPNQNTIAPETKQVWQDASGKDMDLLKMNTFLSRLSKLKCKKYLTDKTRDDLGDAICTVHLKGPNEYSISLFAMDEDNQEYPAISSQNDYIFALDKTTADSIIAAFDEKKEETGLRPD